MPHIYVDTSDLNAPYDQWASARPLQGLGARHLYMDYSNLNAQYDRARPAIHGLGGGSLGGSALGNSMGGKLIGIGAAQDDCGVYTSAHVRMATGQPAKPGDVELIAEWNNNTANYGCPVKGALYWFWPEAPTSAWTWRDIGPGRHPWEEDWDRLTETGQSMLVKDYGQTLYVPPYLADNVPPMPVVAGSASSAPDEYPPPSSITKQDIEQLQAGMNTQLRQLGCNPIQVDGQAGPKTCGALLYIDKNVKELTPEFADVMGPYVVTIMDQMCTSFDYGCKGQTITQRQRNGGAVRSAATGAKPAGDMNAWLIGGAVVVAAALIGGAVYYRQRYG